MNGTALLIKEDYTVKILEDIEKQQFEVLKAKENTHKTNPAVSFIYHEDAIDWDYGY